MCLWVDIVNATTGSACADSASNTTDSRCSSLNMGCAFHSQFRDNLSVHAKPVVVTASMLNQSVMPRCVHGRTKTTITNTNVKRREAHSS